MALKQRQLAYIEFLLANPLLTNTEAGEKIGVSRNTISKWKDNPEFKEEYKKRLKEKWEDSELMAMEMMQKLARDGNFQASKYILDSQGYAPTTKIEADINADINIVIEE
ncbi:MAG: hypothetical protein IKY67_06690 [Paludibacteraceae bacterium]|nr:hypothetical protein [Paludibacteraceae bacterium]